MNLKEIEKVVAGIRSNLFRNSNSFSVGMLRSHFRGAGIQFKEHQVYNPGDDVRFIDWKLSAKTNTTFVKTFEEERNVEIYPIIDISETMLVGYKGISKLQAAIEITCLLYLLVDKSKDKLAPTIVTDKLITLPLSSGQEGITLFVSQLEKNGVLNNKGKVCLEKDYSNHIEEKKLHSYLKSLVARHKEVVFFSDFNDLANKEDYEKLLYHHNFHCMKLESPLDHGDKKMFSIFARRSGESFQSLQSEKLEKKELKGRLRRINVKDRYLESFVREML
jgi:uncharacterized protein (DUF58 family)